jgi:phospholipid transport system substrate-binding protein
MRTSLNFAGLNFARPQIFVGVLLAAVFAFGLAVAPALAASPAEEYIEANINRGLQILNNDSVPKDERMTQFRTFLLGLTDLKRIAVFTLGPVKNTTSPADLAAFDDAFREYAFAVYETEFAQYSGQTLKVTGSIAHGPNDWLVRTKLIDPHAKPGDQPTEVDFRVFGTPGHFTVGDITVLGMDLAITEQDQFTSFLQEHNNDVKALTADLKERAANVRSSGQVNGGK